MSIWLTALLVFALGVGFDLMYVQWTLSAVAGRIGRATVLAAAIAAVSALSVLLFVARWELIIPNILGHTLGSYLALRVRKA